MTRGLTAAPDAHATNNIGVWTTTLTGDKSGTVYVYKLTFANGTVSDYPNATYGTYTSASATQTTNDPYSIAVTQGGQRSVVESPSALTASGFSVSQGSAATWRVASPTQLIVDELHIRDFTNSSTSGVSTANRGKFLGVVQSGTTDPNTNTPTGLDYLKATGFNYVQLMPASEYASVSETGSTTAALPNVYNWGYDPMNYNVPEGQYASDSVNPTVRVKEMKQMVQGLHNTGIGVIMDVVYNHVYDQTSSPFEKTEPGYYFRKTAATGCGNDTASNHEMFSKYIQDSVAYWAKNYDIDGFRFDLMANIDIPTMNKVRAELTAIDPHIITYGEGWGMGTDIPGEEQATEGNALKTPGIGYFNDGERMAIRGDNTATGGQAFVDGNTSTTLDVVRALLASGGYGDKSALRNFLTPAQSLNYIDCHDGNTLSDQLYLNDPNDTTTTHTARQELANAINLLSNGMSFMQVGQEFERTKNVSVNGISSATRLPDGRPYYANSYNGVVNVAGTDYYLGDAMNNINWDLVKTHQAEVNFTATLIKFKTAHPEFWPNDYSQLYNGQLYNMTTTSNGLITYEMTSGTTKYLVVLNASGASVTLGAGGSSYGTTDLTGKTLVVSNDTTLSGETGKPLTTSSVTLQNLSATVIQLTN
jgi:pullulanase